MRYVLKDYQHEAVREVLTRLDRARSDVDEYDADVAFALSAITGAGKTVIAATVIEALFRGSDEFEVDADPDAVILWVTDDPSLNEQTRFRIQDSADRLAPSDLVTIGEGFNQKTFDTGRVYFLNVQKLGSATSYVKTSNDREYTLWDTIKNTIEHPDRRLDHDLGRGPPRYAAQAVQER